MKKVLFLAVALILMAGSAYADSDSLGSGLLTQGGGAITMPTWNNGKDLFGNAGAGGNQQGSATFYANPSNPAGESLIGNIDLNGHVIVEAGVTHIDGTSITSWASGDVGNSGIVTISETGGLTPTATTTLSGSGLLLLATFASLGAGSDGTGTIKEGGWAGGSLTGSFSYNANGGYGWEGGGSAVGNLSSTVTKLPNGYTSISGGHLTVTVCPK